MKGINLRRAIHIHWLTINGEEREGESPVIITTQLPTGRVLVLVPPVFLASVRVIGIPLTGPQTR